MEPRINLIEKGKQTLAPVFGIAAYLARSPIDKKLLHLIEYRVSQINGCAYCLDMHSKDLRHEGESEQRIYLISAWRETDLFTAREKAAFAWAEAVTTLPNGQVPDDVFQTAKNEFSDEELLDLTLAVTSINVWNRFNIAFRTPAGSYQPGQFANATAV
ncbi:MAG: carboxymuconolactone decarboxylase family protein [Pyrinomonadaceae bacterium]